MKLEKIDLEMLPTWVTCGKHTIAFMEWILEDNGKPFVINSEMLIMVQKGAFIFLYHIEESNETFLQIGKDATFAGICHTRDYALYDLSYHLRNMLGILKGYYTDKAAVMNEAEKEINSQLATLFASEWNTIQKEAAYDKKDLIPVVNKDEMRSRAEILYLESKKPEEISYQPEFSYGHISRFSDEGYLLYLSDRGRVAKAVARSWLKRNVPFVSQQKVLCGCIREELYSIYQNKNDRMHKIKRLRVALMEADKKTVVVIAKKYGQSIQFRMQTEELKKRQGKYSAMCIAARDRAQFMKIFRRQSEFQVEDIEQVLQKGRLLYDQNDNEETR